jgi:hypothetical protein
MPADELCNIREINNHRLQLDCNLTFDTAQESHCQLLAIAEFRDELRVRCLHLQAEMDTVLKFTIA